VFELIFKNMTRYREDIAVVIQVLTDIFLL